jgi:beta-barrel assembly-enhancing protease
LIDSRLTKLMLLLSFWFPAQAGAADIAAASSDPPLVSMRALDERVATVGHRLAVAGLDLCRDQAWLPGFALHDLSQYAADDRTAVSRAFGLNAGPAILAVAESGAAARAGLRPDDIVLRLDGVAPPTGSLPSGPSFDLMERILAALDDALADGAVQIEVRRAGAPMTIALRAERGCATRFQLIPSRRLNALADGRYVQVTTAIGDYVANDQELAAVLAHELAHNVLRHRVRLDAAGISRGLLGNFGRNARLIRETEAEADRLSIYLLDRAGYDPEAAVRFWERFGRRGLNFIGSPTHGNWRTRVAMLRAEIDNVRRARAAGQIPVPPFLPSGG